MTTEAQKAWHAAHRAENRARSRAHYLANRQAYIDRARARERMDPAERAARTRKRQADKIRRTPPWADMRAIREVYRAARVAGCEVDHIIPLRGRHVSGLHVESNLQLLLPVENKRKANNWVFPEHKRDAAAKPLVDAGG